MEKVAGNNAHDNYSAILIRICEDAPGDITETGLFRLHRRLKDSTGNFEDFEYFRTRTDAHSRLVELANYGLEKDIFQYGVVRSIDKI